LREKNVKEFGLSAICGERKQTPRFGVSRWNYGKMIEPMEARRLLGVQDEPILSSHLVSTIYKFEELSQLP